ncbi:MAG: host attachment protein [Alphaproteobacteria bacterium]|nr:host attachment protein [Alphaproteobacteria bacterium]
MECCRPTTGMGRLVAKTVTWVVVADTASAAVYANAGKGEGLQDVHAFATGEANATRQNIVSDRPGRTYNMLGSARRGMEPHTDPKDVARGVFLRKAVDYLHDADHRRQFDALVLVAPPRALGRLRKLLPAHLAERLKAEVKKDLTQESIPKLVGHLADVIRL